MRLVIDKDFNERTLLQESYEKSKPTYKVRAVNSDDKFIYAKNLKTINEAVEAVKSMRCDENFSDCSGEIVQIVNGNESIIWSSDDKVVVEESSLSGVFGAIKDWFTNDNFLDKDMKVTGAGYNLLKQYADLNTFKLKPNDVFEKAINSGMGEKLSKFWKKIGEPDQKQDQIDKTANPEKVQELKDKVNNVLTAYRTIYGGIKTSLDKKYGSEGTLSVIENGEAKPITFAYEGKNEDGTPVNFMVSQDAEMKDKEGKPIEQDKSLLKAIGDAMKRGAEKLFQNQENADAKETDDGDGDADFDSPSGNAPAENTPLATATPEKVEQAVDKDAKAAVKTIGQQVAKNTQDIADIMDNLTTPENESTKKMVWNFNGKQNTDKQGMERLAISTFFKTLNESNIKGIKFVDFNGNVKKYDLSNGSSAYAQFKKDFKESTSSANGKFAEYKFTIKNKATESKLSGFKFSDFGDIEQITESKDIVLTASVVDFKTGGDDDTKTKTSPVTESNEEKVDTKEVVNESLVLEMDVVNPADQIKALVASMNKFTSGKPETSPLTKPTANVSTPVSTFGMPEQEVVAEAEGDEEGGDEADPFADDAGGGDEGGDAGGEADPFADDAGGGEEGGDAGAEGGDAGGDPFGGGDAGGGDAGGAEGGDAGEDAAAIDDPNSPEGEPAAEPAINTDAQGNQKSQYNINVTKAFNVDDSFELNEEEQQEFFGKIDQLVKIPDMENYALYLYQITPENVNLDDVHYITALYELSVKLGLLEDVYADSNLLEKYSSYKYSVVKNGEEGENGQDELTIQEGRKYAIMEGTDKPKVQKDNEEKNEKSKKAGKSKDDDERRGPKDMKLDKDENGADKPVIIDANEYGWENKDKKLSSSTEMDDFRGLGWVVTFKAMQFGSPRYMTMYIKKNGDEKAETQCKKYLEKLSYTEIDIVKIEEIDPYEYVYRNGAAGMKSVEEVHGAAVVNKDIPYLESTKEEQPSIVKEGAMAKLIPEDVKRDVKGVLTKLNAEIRNTKQFNFANECGVYKPQLDHVEFMNCYRTAQVDETIGDTTYKFILKKNDSMMSRMFYSNLQEKLFKYLGTFATKYNMECNCQACPTYIMIDFVRSDLNNPMGYDLDTMIDKEEALPEAPAI